VVKLDAREGAQVTATQPLFEIASLDPVWLVVDYSPGQAQALRVGSEVSATAAEGGEVFHGRVSELLPQLDPTTRTLKARIVLENPAQKLRPGMFLTVTQSAAAAQPAVLAVPEEALIDTGTQRRVLVASGDGYFKPVNVTTGITAGGWTQIVSGLQEGDNVVTSGQFLIDSEASLRSALPASPAQDTTHNHTMPMEDAK